MSLIADHQTWKQSRRHRPWIFFNVETLGSCANFAKVIFALNPWGSFVCAKNPIKELQQFSTYFEWVFEKILFHPRFPPKAPFKDGILHECHEHARGRILAIVKDFVEFPSHLQVWYVQSNNLWFAHEWGNLKGKDKIFLFAKEMPESNAWYMIYDMIWCI